MNRNCQNQRQETEEEEELTQQRSHLLIQRKVKSDQ